MANPITNFIDWVRALFNKDNFTTIIGDTALSTEMQAAISRWMGAFQARPEWGMDLSNFAEVLTGHVATLATNEIGINCGSGKRAEFVHAQLSRHVLANVKQSVQLACAGGLCALKPYVIGGEIYCDFVDAINFIPVRYNGNRIDAAIFLDTVTHGQSTFVLIERHNLQGATYTIQHEAYTSNGQKIPLGDVPEWASRQPLVTIRNLEAPLFAVLRTAKVNTVDRSRSPVSIFAGAMGTLQEIDSILRDVRYERQSGRRKKIMDAQAVDFSQAEDGRIQMAYPPDEFVLVNPLQGSAKPFDDYSPAMRIEAYQAALNTQLRLLEMQAGLSTGTFDFNLARGGIKTATEIISEDKTTYNTIKALQENGLRQGLKHIAYIYHVYATLAALAPPGAIDVNVTFGDSIFEDTATEFARRLQLVNAGLLKGESLLQYYFNVDAAGAKALMPQAQAPPLPPGSP